MKPEQLYCLNCNKEITRGKYCSDKCRMAYKRNPNKANTQPEQMVPKGEQTRTESESEQKVEHTKADQTFYDRSDSIIGKDYYIFDGPLHEETCLHCGDKFETHMPYLRFCSYRHYKDELGGRK